MTVLRLVLGDQLNPDHAWFARRESGVHYVLMEVRQETDYVLHHAQKILAVFAAMRAFAAHLAATGHRVTYLAIDGADNLPSIPANLDHLIGRLEATALEYQSPDEWRLDRQLANYASGLAVPARQVGSGHFLTARDECAAFFGRRARWTMEPFYRHMRRRHAVLLEPDGTPAGGRWNFDRDNRKAWRGTPAEPPDPRPLHDHRALWTAIEAAGVESFGAPEASALRWPLDRREALAQLDAFVRHALPWFGHYQDAMSARAHHLFHSLLSFALNLKMLSPREVIGRAQAAWQEGRAPLQAAEGFIRQILGWREYVRGVYWAHMPGYAQANALDHHRALPHWFWDGQTRMNCLRHAIGQSLAYAHAHHIQRLMVIGNFALLAGLDPQAVHRWYLGVYVDAFEWVELPNTLGMSQFADGGLLATKPYAASASYMHRMGDYCQGCRYRRAQATGNDACPFNALYWDFLARQRERLGHNPRLAMAYRQLASFPAAKLTALRAHAAGVLDRLESL